MFATEKEDISFVRLMAGKIITLKALNCAFYNAKTANVYITIF